MLRYRSAWQSNGIPSKAVRPTRNLWANESKKKNRFSFCRVPQKISLAESFAFTRLVVIPNEYEESPAFYRLIFFTPLMLHSEWHTAKSCNILREILQGKAFQNDIPVISNEGEKSHTNALFGKRFFGVIPLRMTHCTIRISSLGNVISNRDLWSSVRNLRLSAKDSSGSGPSERHCAARTVILWVGFFTPPCFVQNDNAP